MKKPEVIALIAEMLKDATPNQLITIHNNIKATGTPTLTHVGYGVFETV